MIIIVGGVSGTGKSTIGKLLADKLQLPFFDGDDFHPQSNVEKMKSGNPLNDEDRKPWLELLAKELAFHESNQGAVLACSALKESYREILASQCKTDINWVLLNGSAEILTERLEARQGHFMGSKLLQSQLDTLELPNYGLIVDVQDSIENIVTDVSKKLVENSIPVNKNND